MTDIKSNLNKFNTELAETNCKLVAVSKTKPVELLQTAYEAGARIFGENKAQEMASKFEELPKDINWHFIGHLQTNKVKYIAPFVGLVHSVDSLKVLKEINKRAKQNERVINCLLQMHIAEEETKFGLSEQELEELLVSEEFANMGNIQIVGLMGMATNTENQDQIRKEFKGLKQVFGRIQSKYNSPQVQLTELSMGMSGDYKIAIEEGSTLIRVGSSIFGARNYA
ncbi:MAG: pyridoxal phosphate enzyme (YggS family) [Arenicella sp.]|jgi:pyridoxal phosphate enzyme (YggS family)